MNHTSSLQTRLKQLLSGLTLGAMILASGTAFAQPTPPWKVDKDGDGYTPVQGDCNDRNPNIHPGATDVCGDGIDQDCSGSDSTCDVDADGDGYTVAQGDCNDNDASINPGAAEVCDGKDQDCDGTIDDGVKTRYYQDADGDGYGNATQYQEACTKPAGYVTNGTDCNDTNASVYPGATEKCDALDNDCDGSVDEGATTTWYRDADADTYGSNSSTTSACSQPSGYVSRGGDCNDSNAAINPGATEVCDGVDNDCDSSVDEGTSSTTWYRDADADTYGVSTSTTTACTQPSGYASRSGDCNDSNAAINPGATEVCDGVDQDCDSQIDEGTFNTYYRDADADGYGNKSNSVQACTAPSGYVTTQGDCNDNDNTVYPGATELCDSKDNDCDSSIDEGASKTWYRDVDGDGYGVSTTTTTSCTQPSGYVATSGDCNDADASINPGATEVCDSKDNDCDGSTDEGTTASTWYRDADADTYGTSTDTKSQCGQPSGYVSRSGDCNDANAAINPAATEVCDSVDNDCDSSVDEGVKTTYYRDADGDGYGTSATSTQACSAPSGYVTNSTDCNDSSAAINPGATETCDGVDNNCNSSIDEGVKTTYYRDADGDGYGTSATSTQACSKPTGYVTNSTDCNDSSAAINPAAIEVCDSVDNDCDGQIDEGGSTTWYRDADADGYGTSSSTTQSCTKPTGYASVAGDCNDSNAAINPGATEVCDSIDNDCDGSKDEGFDADGDTYTTCGGDCNDANSSIKPGATELCDSIDNDCDGQVDEGTSSKTYYRDYDADSYGTTTDTKTACSQPSGYVTRSGDCNDKMWSVNPDGYEICNGLDDDCDTYIDATDTFDVTTGNLGTMNGACDNFDRVVGADVGYLKVSYNFAGVPGTLTFYDRLMAAGHTVGTKPTSSYSWPSGCTYFDTGYFWYDFTDPTATYGVQMCFSKGTDAGGKDEFYLNVNYLGINIRGVFDNESDSDSADFDSVYYSSSESTTTSAVWYINDTASASGPGYTATLEVKDMRAVIDLDN